MSAPSDARALQPERSSSVGDATVGGGFVRPFRREDIPGVVTLRRHAFGRSERDTPSDLADYFEVLFFGSPWCDPAFPSWVFEDERGAVGGFVGVLPRPMIWKGRPILAAVATQLMVAPGMSAPIGRKLAKAFFSGAQDLSIADSADDVARRLWLSMGGIASPGRRTSWHRVLGSHAVPPVGTYAATLDPAELLSCMIDVLRSYRLSPAYDLRSLAWLLRVASAKKQFGRLCGGVVRDFEGSAVGWLLFYAGTASRRAEVLQMGSIPGGRGLVLQQAMWQAKSQGARVLGGRVEPSFRSALAAAQCKFTASGPWFLLKGDDPDLLADLEPGRHDVFLSRLDGEWWLAF
jgi:hypothetical protein